MSNDSSLQLVSHPSKARTMSPLVSDPSLFDFALALLFISGRGEKSEERSAYSTCGSSVSLSDSIFDSVSPSFSNSVSEVSELSKVVLSVSGIDEETVWSTLFGFVQAVLRSISITREVEIKEVRVFFIFAYPFCKG